MYLRACSVALLPALVACGVGSPLRPPTDGMDEPAGDAGPSAPPGGCDEALAAAMDPAFVAAWEGPACNTCHAAAGAPYASVFGIDTTTTTALSAALRGEVQPGVAAAQTKLGEFMNLGDEADEIHTGPSQQAGFPTEPLKSAAIAWIEAAQVAVCGPPVDAGVVDAGPPDAGVVVVDAGQPDAGPGDVDAGCRLEDADSLAEFSSRDLGTKLNACATCHKISTTSTTGVGTAWGVGGGANSNDQTWHTAARAIADRPGTTDPTATTLYTHLNGSDATHPVDATARDAMAAWLTLYLDGVPCGGPPGDGGVVDGGPDGGT